MSQKRKLNAEEKVEIVRKYQQGKISLVQAARDAGVGTTTIFCPAAGTSAGGIETTERCPILGRSGSRTGTVRSTKQSVVEQLRQAGERNQKQGKAPQKEQEQKMEL